MNFKLLSYFTLFQICLLGPTLHAQDQIKWVSWEEAMQSIERAELLGIKPKKILVDVYTDWCVWCKQMDESTYADPKIVAFINEHFYAVRFNAEYRRTIRIKGQSFHFVVLNERKGTGFHALAYALLDGEMRFPSTVFLDHNLKLMQRVPGYLDIATMYPIISYMTSDEYGKTPWVEYQKDFMEQQRAVAQPKPRSNAFPVRD